MADNQEVEKIWTWDMTVPGLAASPITLEVQKEHIQRYAKSIQNMNPIHWDEEAAHKEGLRTVVAPPTMCFSYAPMRRWELFNERGYRSPEQAATPRSTPYAGSEITFQGEPIFAGDKITSVTTIDKKWESKSGNKFVGFRVTATNQNGKKVLEYVYNVIWEYSKGQKSRPETLTPAQPGRAH